MAKRKAPAMNAKYEVVCVGTPKGVKAQGRPFVSGGRASKTQKIISYHMKYSPAIKKAKAVAKKGADVCMVRSGFKAIYTTAKAKRK